MPGIRRSREREGGLSYGSSLGSTGSKGGAKIRRSRSDTTTATPFMVNSLTDGGPTGVVKGKRIRRSATHPSGDALFPAGAGSYIVPRGT